MSNVPMWTLPLGMLLLSACGRAEQRVQREQEDGSAQTMAALQAAPCDIVEGSAINDSTVARFLTGASRLDAEVYDCQRLVLSVGPTGEFGPLVAVYPVDATLRRSRSEFATPRPAAAVYSWGANGRPYADAYPEFAPGPGASCVWLRNGSADPTGWQAAIVGGTGCGGDGTAPADSAFAQPVFERVYTGTGAGDYPRTARWEWAADAAKHFIGVKCGDAWCAIVASGSGEPRTQRYEGGNGVARERVPGWSDAQHLAVFDSAVGRVRPGPWGSIVAYPGLAEESPPWTEGLLSARIRVYEPASALADRFYLEPEGDAGYDDLILRFPGLDDEAWLQQGPMRRRKATRIDFTPSLEHVVTGAVRWRWREGAETIWIYCPNATCGVEP